MERESKDKAGKLSAASQRELAGKVVGGALYSTSDEHLAISPT